MRILVAEDNVVIQRILETSLKTWGYEVILASDGTEAWKILAGPNAPQLAILDWMMPGLSGIELCRKIRQEMREPYTYVILLTALHGDDELVTGMEAGADDYITKPFKLPELRVRLRAGRRVIDLQTDLVQAREALRLKASRDQLTGLWNHEEIFHLLDLELFRAERQLTPVAMKAPQLLEPHVPCGNTNTDWELLGKLGSRPPHVGHRREEQNGRLSAHKRIG